MVKTDFRDARRPFEFHPMNNRSARVLTIIVFERAYYATLRAKIAFTFSVKLTINVRGLVEIRYKRCLTNARTPTKPTNGIYSTPTNKIGLRNEFKIRNAWLLLDASCIRSTTSRNVIAVHLLGAALPARNTERVRLSDPRILNERFPGVP